MAECVLVPLDGSDADDRAITAASAMITLTGCNARLLRIFDPPTVALSQRMLTMGGLDAAQRRLAEASVTLSDAAARLSKSTGKEVSGEIAEGFDVAQMIVDRAARDTSVVVMGTRAAVGADRALRGSVADHVMRHSMRPVLLVPPRTEGSASNAVAFERVLVPLDGAQLSLNALNDLVELDGNRRLEYVLLEVVPAGSDHSLTSVADRLRASGVRRVDVRAVIDDDAAATIIRVARAEKVDFIAMSSRGLHGVERFVLGSVASAVVQESTIPVFVRAGNSSESGDTGVRSAAGH